MNEPQMTNETRWNRYHTALQQYVTRTGTARVPSNHTETIDGGATVALGSWVGYVRQRQRAGLLPNNRIEALNQIPGWFWEALRPGPPTDTARDSEIIALRQQGVSLQEIGDRFGLSRQRVHQIVKGK
jgi:hypothetical protein